MEQDSVREVHRPATGPPGDLSGKLHAATASLIGYGQLRLELLQCEWAIERVRLGTLLTCNMFMLFFSFLTLEMTALLIVAWFWDTVWRLEAIAAVALISLVASIIARAVYRSKQSEPSALFSASVEELARDRRALDGLQ